MKSGIIALTTLLLFSGCDHIHTDDMAAEKLIQASVVKYTPAQQDKMADEVASGKCPALTDAAKDGGVMRDQVRAAK